MPQISKLLFVLLLIFTIKLDSFAQFSLRTVAQKLVNIWPQEKVYLTFDKPYYGAGETLHFKAFTVMASSHKMDTIGGILYLDVLDEKTDALHSRKTLPLIDGVAHGTIETDSLTSHLKIVAYTRWMLNFPPALMYRTTISVFPNEKQEIVAIKPENEAINVRFFPEGGNAVLNLASHVAVKSTDSEGNGVSVKGLVMDTEGVFVDSFMTSEMGFTHFIFKPLANKTYKALHCETFQL